MAIETNRRTLLLALRNQHVVSTKTIVVEDKEVPQVSALVLSTDTIKETVTISDGRYSLEEFLVKFDFKNPEVSELIRKYYAGEPIANFR